MHINFSKKKVEGLKIAGSTLVSSDDDFLNIFLIDFLDEG